MSVIIKGMAMPETCYECRFCEEEQQYPFRLYCVAHYNLIKHPRSGRLDTCPLEDLERNEEDENWYTELDDPKIAERNEE